MPAGSLANAASVGANCHVDACMGGFVLPFAEMLGRDIPPWDFRVEGVSSISADIHKLGYVPYPAGAVLFRDYHVRDSISYAAPYLPTDGSVGFGGFLGKWTLEGSRPGAPRGRLKPGAPPRVGRRNPPVPAIRRFPWT